MHEINLIWTLIYKDVQTEHYISHQSAEIVKILLYLLLKWDNLLLKILEIILI